MTPKRIPATYDLYNALLDEGYTLPDECADVHLEMPVDGIFQLVCRINITGDNLIKIGRALTTIGARSNGS